MNSPQDRWIPPGNKCDCCHRLRAEGEPAWYDWHTNTGISGFTFNFCPECEKNEEACWNVIEECLKTWEERQKKSKS